MAGCDPVARLGEQVRDGWSLNLYEGGGCFVPARPVARAGGGPAADPVRARLGKARQRVTCRSTWPRRSSTPTAVRGLRGCIGDVGQGFAPRAVRLSASSRWGVIEAASEVMGGRPSTWWFSEQVEGWQGAPALWLQWDR